MAWRKRPKATPTQAKTQRIKVHLDTQSKQQPTRRVSTGIEEPAVKPPSIPTSTVSEKSVSPIVQYDSSFYSDFIINNWYETLSHYSSGEAYTLLKNWASDMIAQNGKDAFAEMLQQGTADGNILTWETVYKVGEAERYISNMLDYLPDTSALYKDEITDKFDYYRAMTDAMEQNEDWEEPE